MTDQLTRREFVVGTTAATLGTALAGCLGDGDDDTPDASFVFERDGNDLTVTHDGGSTLDEDNTGAVQIVIEAESPLVLGTWERPISEGDEVTVQAQFESGQTIAVRWFTPDNEEFADLDTYEVE